MTDIVERLRAGFFCREEAADEIERLRGAAQAPTEGRELTDLESKLIQQALIDSGTPLYAPAQRPMDCSFMMQEVLDFLNSIEGAGYGGMASFEIARGYARELALSSTPSEAAQAPKMVSDDKLAERFSDACFDGHADGPSWSTVYQNMLSLIENVRAPAQEVPERGSLTRLAAECHRSKWQFDLSEDYKPTARVARDMILRAFRELHRIGDLAMKLRDASPLPSTHQRETYCALCDREHQLHEDAQGFHHVIRGERVTCPVPSTNGNTP